MKCDEVKQNIKGQLKKAEFISTYGPVVIIVGLSAHFVDDWKMHQYCLQTHKVLSTQYLAEITNKIIMVATDNGQNIKMQSLKSLVLAKHYSLQWSCIWEESVNL